jgi:hypothetical protein
MTMAGDASMGTTRRYMHVARVVFRGAADRLGARLLGDESETVSVVA